MSASGRATGAGLPRRLSRRRFVLSTLALAAGGALAWNTSGYPPPRRLRHRLRTLSAKEYAIVAAAAERILRADGSAFPPAAEVGVAERVDKLVADLERPLRTDLGHLLQVVEHLAPPLSGHFGRFTRLSGAEQDAVLRSMLSSRLHVLRGGLDALKSLCALAYFSAPESFAAMGYDGPFQRYVQPGGP